MQPATVLSLEPVTPSRSQEQQCVTRSAEAVIDDLAHDLRQPLSAIDHLAYLLQMSATDCTVLTHLQQIQDLVSQANRVLDEVKAGSRSAVAVMP